MEIINFGMANLDKIAALLLAVIALGEAIVALTPTKSDDGFVEKVGKWIKGAIRFFIVNNKVK